MKILRYLLIVLVAFAVVAFAGFKYMQYETKKASPEDRVEFREGDLALSIFYNRPSKKGRDIFGGLVPYGEVWRTGANEATTFTTDKALSIDGEALPAGTYTLWTIPGPEQWTVIFNEKMYGWGVSWGAKASREPEADVLQVEVPVETQTPTEEMFTISVTGGDSLQLHLMWDQTRVSVPMQRAQ